MITSVVIAGLILAVAMIPLTVWTSVRMRETDREQAEALDKRINAL